MANNPLLEARQAAERASSDPEELNRRWWSHLPMTYKPWEDAERGLSEVEIIAELSRTFLSINPWLAENFRFDAFADRDVLEIGCGAGAASCLFARGGARLTAIDLTEEAVSMTQKAAQVLRLDVTVRQMNAEQMDFPDRAFDYVFSWGVIHHTRTTENVIAQIARVLRPGGRGLVMVYNRDSLRYWLKGLIWLLLRGRILHGDSVRSVQRFYTDGYFHRHFGKRELAYTLKAQGLSVDRLSVTHMAKHMIPGVPAWADNWLKARYGWLLVAEFSPR